VKKIILFSLILVVGCSEQQSSVEVTPKVVEVTPKVPVEKKPTTLDATRFCKMGSDFSDISYEFSKTLAKGYLAENNISLSYLNTFAGGLVNGQFKVTSKNLDSALDSYMFGGYDSGSLSNNSGEFVTGCVEHITSYL